MAIVKCDICLKDISDKSSQCPYCGNIVGTIYETTNVPKHDNLDVLDAQDSLSSANDKLSRKKIKWIVLSVSLVVILGILVALYLNRGLFVRTIDISSEEIYLNVGEVAKVSYNVFPKYANSGVCFTSNDDEVVTVNKKD